MRLKTAFFTYPKNKMRKEDDVMGKSGDGVCERISEESFNYSGRCNYPEFSPTHSPNMKKYTTGECIPCYF